MPVQRIGGLEAHDEPFRGSLQSWTALNTSWQYEGLATLEALTCTVRCHRCATAPSITRWCSTGPSAAGNCRAWTRPMPMPGRSESCHSSHWGAAPAEAQWPRTVNS